MKNKVGLLENLINLIEWILSILDVFVHTLWNITLHRVLFRLNLFEN